MTTTGVRDGRTTDGRTDGPIDRGGGRIATDRIAGRTNAGRTNAGRTRVSEFLNLDFALRRRTDGWSTEERSKPKSNRTTSVSSSGEDGIRSCGRSR